jgi:hypothetical protein
MLLIRRILTSQWDEASRPIAKPELNQRLAALRAPPGFLSLEPHEPELRLLHNRFDTWHGIGDIVAGMVRHEYDLDLRRYNGHGWRAMFAVVVLSTRSLRMPAARGHRARGRPRSARLAMHYAGARHRSGRRGIGLRLTTHDDDAGEL